VQINEMTNSHILVQEFEYLEPTSLREAISLLSSYGGRARVLAGGTDLLVQMKMERLAPACLVSIRRVPGLDEIVLRNGELHIGARTSIYTIRHASQVKAGYPALAEACASFSTMQVQVMGTVGGNLSNGSPASDLAPALIAFNAQVVLSGPNGDRRLPVEAFFHAPGVTALREGELLTSILLPPPRSGTGSAFLKVSRVTADIAKVNAAVVLVREGERIADCRLVFGSVAPTPLRARKAEALLIGKKFSVELVAQAARVASEEVTPIDDVRSTAWYRRQIVGVMAHDGLNMAWERAKTTGVSEAPEVWQGEPPGREAEITSAPTLPVPPVPEAQWRVRVQPTEKHLIELTVNGERRRLWVASNDLLLNVLREELELTGSKYGCGIGECGACTVQMNGRPVLSCLVLAIAADGSEIVTVEGLRGANGELDPLQEAFIEHAAFQCGYCTPGMLMTAKSLLSETPCPTEEEVRDYLKGNLCRCTGYASIVRAVMKGVIHATGIRSPDAPDAAGGPQAVSRRGT
jgi:xanthine dehydrogenase iron-sulfur cluster and FAD-binding subunit A